MFQRASLIDRKNVQSRTNLGALAHLVRKDIVLAEKRYTEALSLHAAHLPTLLNLALLMKETGDMRRAESYYTRALDADPTDPSVLSDFAMFIMQVEEFLRSFFGMEWEEASSPLIFSFSFFSFDPPQKKSLFFA